MLKALDTLDAVSGFAIKCQIPIDQLFDSKVIERLRGLKLVEPPSRHIYPETSSNKLRIPKRLKPFSRRLSPPPEASSNELRVSQLPELREPSLSRITPPPDTSSNELQVSEPPDLHPSLEKSSNEEKKTLLSYCKKLEVSKEKFKGVLDSLDAYREQILEWDSASKGKVIDTIIRSGDPENLKAQGSVLWVIGSVALKRIRDRDARSIAAARGHNWETPEDKTSAADGMYKELELFNPEASRKQLNYRIQAGMRWDAFLDGMEEGILVVLHVLPSSL